MTVRRTGARARTSAETRSATETPAVSAVVPATSSRTIPRRPESTAIVTRRIEPGSCGARQLSRRASAVETRAVRASAQTSHSGRPSHHGALPGSGSSVPETIAVRAMPPAIVSSSGMCQR
ncbi:hypothetical protein GCM10027408_17810 [Microbacterium tumbae]